MCLLGSSLNRIEFKKKEIQSWVWPGKNEVESSLQIISVLNGDATEHSLFPKDPKHPIDLDQQFTPNYKLYLLEHQNNQWT